MATRKRGRGRPELDGKGQDKTDGSLEETEDKRNDTAGRSGGGWGVANTEIE